MKLKNRNVNHVRLVDKEILEERLSILLEEVYEEHEKKGYYTPFAEYITYNEESFAVSEYLMDYIERATRYMLDRGVDVDELE